MNVLAVAALSLLPLLGGEAVSLEADLNEAKALFFDRKYEESRARWTEIAAARGPSAEAASYWIARCSESLGESERAFREYGAFLDLPPQDARLAEEAEISRIGLATKLTRAGKAGFQSAVVRALGDDRESVRYFAALQVATFTNPADARKAVPVLREIVKTSKDADIAERAKLHLLKLEPRSLAGSSAGGVSVGPRSGSASSDRGPAASSSASVSGKEPAGAARLLRLRITKDGKQTVAVTVPFSFAEFVFGSLPDSTKRGLELKGYDAEGFWKRLRTLNIREIISITGDDGETIEIWIE